jgi:hypothetical protein
MYSHIVAQANSLLARMCDSVDVVRKEAGIAMVVVAQQDAFVGLKEKESLKAFVGLK